ncbi:TPA: hypothetical protein HA219_04210 [Candidatus Woesearchaeota archaeon]|nr:hypothetical protein [uncultured archaeon]AQS32062.1 hypothetical protein [uncultured archaeon]MBS3115256.1 hypothetical protein [Candidatus Woesearchaeota archaeon]HIH39894.1 hypothetical protein [Candidatus Woesearchaeota archaeon]
MTQTTIQLSKKTVELLNKSKDHPRQTYNELVEHMAKIHLVAKKATNYDRYIHEIQKEKMKELWDNEIDNQVWG